METVLLSGKEINAETWDAFVKASPQGMIYSCHHFISTLQPGWHAIIVRNNNTIHAAMPIVLKKKAGMTYSTQPIFTQYWGIMFRPMDTNTAKAFEQKRQWVKAVINALPADIRLFNYNFSPAFDYPLPFFWNGYSVVPRYSNHLDLRKTKAELWANISAKTKWQIRKTEKNGFTTTEAKSTDIDDVIKIFRRAKEQKLKDIKEHHYKALAEIAGHYAERGECHTILSKNDKGEPVAGAIFFNYKQTTIYFMGATDPEYKSSGAMSLILWTAIQRATEDAHTFDFEGSMIEPIEQFFLSFGSVPTPYLTIKKENLPLPVRLLYKLRSK